MSSLKYRFLWKIHSCTLYICIISSHVRYNLLFSFGCSGEPVRRYVSSLKYRFLWKKYTHLMCTLYNICWIISSRVRYNLLFSFGCSGEPVRRYVSSLKYRFLCKIHSCTLYMHIHLMYAIICYFLLDVRANQSGGTWVPWSIDSFEKYTRVLL